MTNYKLNDIEAGMIEKYREQETKKKLARKIIFFTPLIFERWMKRNKDDGDFSWSNFINNEDHWGIPKDLKGQEKLLFKLIDEYRTTSVKVVNKVIRNT